jgi:hypothetical protein
MADSELDYHLEKSPWGPCPWNMRGEWFKLIHDLTPTNARLHAINISPTDKCTICKQIDTIQHHRITECVEGQETWNWVCKKLAMIIRIDPKYIPADWLWDQTSTCGHHKNIGQHYGYWCTWRFTERSAHNHWRQLTSWISWGEADGKPTKDTTDRRN